MTCFSRKTSESRVSLLACASPLELSPWVIESFFFCWDEWSHEIGTDSVKPFRQALAALPSWTYWMYASSGVCGLEQIISEHPWISFEYWIRYKSYLKKLANYNIVQFFPYRRPPHQYFGCDSFTVWVGMKMLLRAR